MTTTMSDKYQTSRSERHQSHRQGLPSGEKPNARLSSRKANPSQPRRPQKSFSRVKTPVIPQGSTPNMCATQADERDETKQERQRETRQKRQQQRRERQNETTSIPPLLQAPMAQSFFFANPPLFLFSWFFVCFSFSTVFVLFVFLLGHAVMSSGDERKVRHQEVIGPRLASSSSYQIWETVQVRGGALRRPWVMSMGLHMVV
jgi:cation transport ATPase